MELRGRKFLEEICTLICQGSCSTNCPCVEKCSIGPQVYSYPPPTPPIFIDEEDHPVKPHNHKISTFLIVIIAILAAAFFVLFCYAIFTRCRRRRVSQQQTEDTHDAFVDEEHGPMVDHPIWYIRTTGLQQSIISAITVCKYKKGEGLIEGTECSVCLSEFEEDENLRLLPKCNHAFHLPCIDTWLRSHTNCPLCRAPIVTNPARIIATPEPNLVDSSSGENTQMEILENSSENNEGIENIAPELRGGEEEEGQLEVGDGRRVCESSSPEVENLQPRRRSVSLDSSSVQKISLTLASILADGNSNRHMGSKRVTGNENLAIVKGSSSSFRIRSLQIAATSMKRSRSFNGKHLLSWYSRSQRKPNLPVRSF